jgi:2'-5' RNA ligase
MPPRPPQYALVTYVRNSLGKFVESMRQELHPDHTHSPAHITILPPRALSGSEEDALETLRKQLAGTEGFQVRVGEVETFHPTTPTVFLRVERDAHRIRDLHDRLNIGPLQCLEPWPFMPHLTIVKMPESHQTEAALGESRRRWREFQGGRTATISDVTFVREGTDGHWVDIATIPLKARNSGTNSGSR